MRRAQSLYVGSTTPFGPGRMSVLRQLASGDQADQEVAAALGMKEKTVSARRTELWHGGYVEPVGLRRMHRQRAKVWRLTAAGRALLRGVVPVGVAPVTGRLF